MQFSLEHKTASLSVGEFADFQIGPRESFGGPHGLWRAQLGQHWHNELRARTEAEAETRGVAASELKFEVPIEGRIIHRGWTFNLNGRIDQLVGTTLREVKSVTCLLPAAEPELRAAYPSYFLQLAAYSVMRRLAGVQSRAELLFVEVVSGIVQTVPLGPFDEALVHHQLDAITGFFDEQARAGRRRRSLRFSSPFASLRAGQESIQGDFTAAFDRPADASAPPIVLFEAPTGFGKTGCVLEFALGRLKSGRFERLVWATGKSTGQLHVVETLRAMTGLAGDGLAMWQVRPKSEHCINHTFHCLRDSCEFLRDCAERWPASGLARFHRDPAQPHDLPALRDAGRAATICPYEITRSSLAFQDVWIGDYNYVFAPDNRGLFFDQPGFDPGSTLLVVDEAHNLPSRVADAHSHAVHAGALREAFDALRMQKTPPELLLFWERWTMIVSQLRPVDELDPDLRDELAGILGRLATLVSSSAVDHASLGPQVSESLWQTASLAAWLDDASLSKLLWCPREGSLRFTCIDAAPAIGATLRQFGGAVLMSATLTPADAFNAACGLDIPPPAPPPSPANDRPEKLGSLTKRTTRKLYRQLSTGADLLRIEEAADSHAPAFLRASAPWRDNAYDVAIDVRVDTTLKQRGRFYGATADTIAAVNAAGKGPTAVFFPSYAYAETVRTAVENSGSFLRVALQPKLPDLAAQSEWVEESLAQMDAIFLVLGSSFAEGIDLLGGRVASAVVVGPALPEVNAVQRARLAALGHRGRDAAFRLVYQVPGLQKVNQALGRLVRAPGQTARVLLHCRRFADATYSSLLAREYRNGREIANESDLREWLGLPPD